MNNAQRRPISLTSARRAAGVGSRWRTSCSRRPYPLKQGAGAFTLLELLIALTIMAVMAALLVPAITGLSGRQARQAVDQVEDILTMYAYRDSTSVQPVALWGGGATEETGGWLGLHVLDRDPAFPDDPALWVPDRFSTVLDLPPYLTIIDVRVDGRRQVLQEFLITRQPSQPRPTIEVDLEGEGVATTVVLDPQALTARRVDASGPAQAHRLQIDLDRGGRDRENW
jgi:prepilin-type N-terminal cleavage/methylation domain-containing protein